MTAPEPPRSTGALWSERMRFSVSSLHKFSHSPCCIMHKWLALCVLDDIVMWRYVRHRTCVAGGRVAVMTLKSDLHIAGGPSEMRFSERMRYNNVFSLDVSMRRNWNDSEMLCRVTLGKGSLKYQRKIAKSQCIGIHVSGRSPSPPPPRSSADWLRKP